MPVDRNRGTRFLGRRRVHRDQSIQKFQKLNEPEFFQLLRTSQRATDNFRSVLRSRVAGVFRGYQSITHNGEDEGLVEEQNNPSVISRPRRYQAYENDTLHVVYPPGGDNTTGSDTADTDPGADDYDDDMDNTDDNPSDDDYQQEDLDEIDDDDEYDGSINNALIDYTEYHLQASLNIQSLIRPSISSIVSTGSRPLVLLNTFAFPMRDERRDALPMEQSSWKMFKACDCPWGTPENGEWVPHLISEKSYGIIGSQKATRFVQLFGPVLRSRAEWFLQTLRSSSFDADPAPMSNRDLVLSHLCRELRLERNDQVVSYLEQAIKNLEQGIASYHNYEVGTPSKQQRLTRSDRALFSLYPIEEDSSAMDVDDENISGAYLVANRLGREHFVCKHHHKRLYPMFVPGHVGAQTNDVATYDVRTGKLSAILKSEAELTDFRGIDPDKIGFVSKVDITVDWEASMEDIRRLHVFVARLGITTMTIFGGDGREISDTPEQVEAETQHVQELLRNSVTGLTKVNVNWGTKLNLSKLLQDVSSTREEKLYLTFKDSRQEMSSVMLIGHLGVPRIKSTLEDLPLVSDGSFLTGKAQSLEIPSVLQLSDETMATIMQAIQTNRALTSLTLDCKATGYGIKSTVAAIESINLELSKGPSPRQPLRRLLLKNNTDNDIAAVFDISLPPPQYHFTKAFALDVTARSNSSLGSVIKAYGSSIRILHIIGLAPGCPNILDVLFESERVPNKLFSLTLLLDQVKKNHIESLAKLQVSSKKTFKQLALIAQPQDTDSRTAILSTLETLQGFQVLLTRTAARDTEEWIVDVIKAVGVSSGSTVVVVESAEELARIVPGFTDAGLHSLKAIFDRSEPGDTPKEDPVVKMAGTPSPPTLGQSK
ncbi:hypothetical protein BGZ47_009730 [Haplosporangium gracile]|nr:hypothetical protein BGZ47_009730 [Haplosporangium gracile]